MRLTMESALNVLRDRLQLAQHIVVLSGAGLSAESGVPTFRDAQTGLWARFRPEDLATPEAFERQPELVWNWYAWRRELVAGAKPHAGHRALADLERTHPSLTIVTQNVDGLHQRAGSTRVLELHGNILRTKCFDCDKIVDRWSDDVVPPRCPHCQGRLRPDVVWFGESLPQETWVAAQSAVAGCDLMLVVGTSGLVEPAASLPRLALRRGVYVVEINLAPAPLTSSASLFLSGAAGEILPRLCNP